MRSKLLKRSAFLKGYRAFAYRPLEPFPLTDTFCHFCHHSLQTVDYNKLGGDDEPIIKGALEHCSNCAFWRWHFAEMEYIGGRGNLIEHSYRGSISKLRMFDPTLPNGCVSEMCQYIRRNPAWWNSASPLALEVFVADILRANYRSAEVFHVGQPNDGGVDVLFIDAEKHKWLIQVKRRESPTASEGVNTLRNLLGVMVLKESKFGIVVSTADHFSYQAQQGTRKAKELGYTIELYDRGQLNRLLDQQMPDRPWYDVVHQQLPSMLPVLERRLPSSFQLPLFTQ